MGSDGSHFNVPVGSDGQSQKRVSANHNLFEEKGEPKRYRTEVLPLTNLTPYRRARPAHVIIIIIIIDRFYTALVSALEQTRCALVARGSE